MTDAYHEKCKRTQRLEESFNEAYIAANAANAEIRTVKAQLAETDAKVIGKLFFKS